MPKITPRQFSKRKTISSSNEKDYKDILRDMAKSPAVKYVAVGVTTALLTRLANNVSDKYPEMAGFLRENIGYMENKLSELKKSIGMEQTVTRH